MLQSLKAYFDSIFGYGSFRKDVTVYIPAQNSLARDIIKRVAEYTSIPTLETNSEAFMVIEDQKIIGTMAIVRFLGRQSGLYPSGVYECAIEDSALDLIIPLLDKPSPEKVEEIFYLFDTQIYESHDETLSDVVWYVTAEYFINEGRTDLIEKMNWLSDWYSDSDSNKDN